MLLCGEPEFENETNTKMIIRRLGSPWSGSGRVLFLVKGSSWFVPSYCALTRQREMRHQTSSLIKNPVRSGLSLMISFNLLTPFLEDLICITGPSRSKASAPELQGENNSAHSRMGKKEKSRAWMVKALSVDLMKPSWVNV